MIKINNHFQSIIKQVNNLPEKLNFKIGETAKILGVAHHVLRYWEKEFPILKPEKFLSQQRMYSKKNIQILLLIKCLLYKERFSIEGLRKHLPSYFKKLKKYEKKMKEGQTEGTEQKAHQLLSSISELRNFISQNQSL